MLKPRRRAAHPVVQQHQRIGPPRQAMRGWLVLSRLDQVLPRRLDQDAGPYHPTGRIRSEPFGKRQHHGFSMSQGTHALAAFIHFSFSKKEADLLSQTREILFDRSLILCQDFVAFGSCGTMPE
jgi:hypothetical protein